jgi:hypothetical protein
MAALRLMKIGTMYLNLAEQRISDCSRALQLARSGQYGCGDCFKDWARAVGEATVTWYQAVGVLLGNTDEFIIRAAQGATNVTHVFPIEILPASTLQAAGIFDTQTKGLNPIPFTAVLNSNRSQVVVTIPSLSMAAKGQRYNGQVFDQNVQTPLVRIVLEVD